MVTKPSPVGALLFISSETSLSETSEGGVPGITEDNNTVPSPVDTSTFELVTLGDPSPIVVDQPNPSALPPAYPLEKYAGFLSAAVSARAAGLTGIGAAQYQEFMRSPRPQWLAENIGTHIKTEVKPANLRDVIFQSGNPYRSIVELICNALDASESGEIRIRTGRGFYEVLDFGRGMDAQVFNENLLVSRLSGQAGGEKSIGRFGVGFNTVFRHLIAQDANLAESYRAALLSGAQIVIQTKSQKTGERAYQHTFFTKDGELWISSQILEEESEFCNLLKSEIQTSGTRVRVFSSDLDEKNLEQQVRHYLRHVDVHRSIILNGQKVNTDVGREVVKKITLEDDREWNLEKRTGAQAHSGVLCVVVGNVTVEQYAIPKTLRMEEEWIIRLPQGTGLSQLREGVYADNEVMDGFARLVDQIVSGEIDKDLHRKMGLLNTLACWAEAIEGESRAHVTGEKLPRSYQGVLQRATGKLLIKQRVYPHDSPLSPLMTGVDNKALVVHAALYDERMLKFFKVPHEFKGGQARYHDKPASDLHFVISPELNATSRHHVYDEKRGIIYLSEEVYENKNKKYILKALSLNDDPRYSYLWEDGKEKTSDVAVSPVSQAQNGETKNFSQGSPGEDTEGSGSDGVSNSVQLSDEELEQARFLEQFLPSHVPEGRVARLQEVLKKHGLSLGNFMPQVPGIVEQAYDLGNGETVFVFGNHDYRMKYQLGFFDGRRVRVDENKFDSIDGFAIGRENSFACFAKTNGFNPVTQIIEYRDGEVRVHSEKFEFDFYFRPQFQATETGFITFFKMKNQQYKVILLEDGKISDFQGGKYNHVHCFAALADGSVGLAANTNESLYFVVYDGSTCSEFQVPKDVHIDLLHIFPDGRYFIYGAGNAGRFLRLIDRFGKTQEIQIKHHDEFYILKDGRIVTDTLLQPSLKFFQIEGDNLRRLDHSMNGELRVVFNDSHLSYLFYYLRGTDDEDESYVLLIIDSTGSREIKISKTEAKKAKGFSRYDFFGNVKVFRPTRDGFGICTSSYSNYPNKKFISVSSEGGVAVTEDSPWSLWSYSEVVGLDVGKNYWRSICLTSPVFLEKCVSDAGLRRLELLGEKGITLNPFLLDLSDEAFSAFLGFDDDRSQYLDITNSARVALLERADVRALTPDQIRDLFLIAEFFKDVAEKNSDFVNRLLLIYPHLNMNEVRQEINDREPSLLLNTLRRYFSLSVRIEPGEGKIGWEGDQKKHEKMLVSIINSYTLNGHQHLSEYESIADVEDPKVKADLVHGIYHLQNAPRAVWLREALQNSLDALYDSDLIKRKIEIDHFQERGRLVTRISDPVGMGETDFVTRFLIPGNADKANRDELRGEFSMGRLALLKDAREVWIKTSRAEDNTVIVAELIPERDDKGKIGDVIVSWQKFEKTDGFVGTMIERVDRASGNLDFDAAALQTYTTELAKGLDANEVEMVLNGVVINERKKVITSVEDEKWGETSLCYSGAKVLAVGGLPLGTIANEIWDLVPPAVQSLWHGVNVLIGLDHRHVKLVPTRDRFRGDHSRSVRKVAQLTTGLLIKGFLMRVSDPLDSANLRDLPVGFFNFDRGLSRVSGEVSEDAEKINHGHWDDVDFSRYVDTTLLLSLLTNIRVNYGELGSFSLAEIEGLYNDGRKDDEKKAILDKLRPHLPREINARLHYAEKISHLDDHIRENKNALIRELGLDSAAERDYGDEKIHLAENITHKGLRYYIDRLTEIAQDFTDQQVRVVVSEDTHGVGYVYPVDLDPVRTIYISLSFDLIQLSSQIAEALASHESLEKFLDEHLPKWIEFISHELAHYAQADVRASYVDQYHTPAFYTTQAQLLLGSLAAS